jgi:SAM-dependent methyltransferase
MTLFSQLTFGPFSSNSRGETSIAIDTSGKYFIKVQLRRNPRKALSMKEEYDVMRRLNGFRCQSCPIVYEHGTIEGISGLNGSEYIIQENVPDDGGHSMADVLLSMIEQKYLGVYQGDIKPANLRFNRKSGICVIIDYDQAVLLDHKTAMLDNQDFMKFCDEYDKIKYGHGQWTRHFSDVSLAPYFVGTALDLSKTSIFHLQKTTNSQSGIYHTIDTKDLFVQGSRAFDIRSKLLDSIDFKLNERVLDVGCNAGLLSLYLDDKDCSVVGVDNDPYIVKAAQIVSNIMGKDVEYRHLDLDQVDHLDQFDTIMLFSVFHHTRYPTENARKISNSCSRFIIETRLTESGKQPIDGIWTDTTRWSFKDLSEMTQAFESIFQGFKFKRNVGCVDKGRYILEFVR